MKKILSLVVVALIAIGHVNAHGMKPTSPVGMSVIKKGAIFKVFYQGEERQKVKVTIYNEEGDAVFVETMSDVDNFMRPYNFSKLPEGDYTISLTDGKQIRLEKISYRKERTARIAHVTRLDKDENKYMLSVVNAGPNTLRINIYDQYNKVIHKDVAHVTGDFARVYNLDRLSGEHTFEVTDKAGNVTRVIR